MSKTLRFFAVLVLVACGGGKPATTAPTLPVGGTADTAPPAETPATAPPAAVGTPSDQVIDRKVLFGNPEKAGVQISPDGKFLSWLAPKDGVLNVWVAPVDKLDAAKAVTADATRPVRTYFWAFDKKHLLYTQDNGGDENFHLFRVELATGTATDLTPEAKVQVQVLGLSHRKPTTVIIGLNDRDPRLHDVYEVDLATGTRKKLEENKDGFAGWDVDNDLAVRFASKITPDGGSAIYRKDPKAGWVEHESISNEDSMTTSMMGFDKGGKKQYWLDSRGRDTAALYVVDGKKAKKLLFEDAKADVANVMIHPTEYTVQAVMVEWDRERWTALDKKVKADLEAIAKLGEGEAFVASRTQDDKVWIVGINGDRQPTRFFRWDRASKKGTFLFSSRPELEDKPLARMNPVIIKSRDGLDLVSYLTLPNAADPDGDGKANAPTPTVLLVHGGPWARDAWGFNGLHQLLANRGYAVLSVNFRGSTGFGKSFINASNGQWGKKMHDDLIDAKEWLVAQAVAPADKVCIMGGSYGGYSTLVGLTMTPEAFACGVDIVGPSSILTLIESIPPYWAPMIGIFKHRVGDWSTPEGKQALEDVSPINHVAAIKRPLLIGQGANDPRVKKGESDRIVAAMQAKGIPVSYVLFPDEGHGFARPENAMTFFAAAEAFLSAHLGGVYQPITADGLKGSTVEIPAGKEGIPGWP